MTTTEKRYFMLDDSGHVQYFIVATDLLHAKQVMRESHCLFGPLEVSFDQASPEVLTWTQMSADDVAKKARCHTDDERGTIALVDAQIGDWFCTEW